MKLFMRKRRFIIVVPSNPNLLYHHYYNNNDSNATAERYFLVSVRLLTNISVGGRFRQDVVTTKETFTKNIIEIT